MPLSRPLRRLGMAENLHMWRAHHQSSSSNCNPCSSSSSTSECCSVASLVRRLPSHGSHNCLDDNAALAHIIDHGCARVGGAPLAAGAPTPMDTSTSNNNNNINTNCGNNSSAPFVGFPSPVGLIDLSTRVRDFLTFVLCF